MRKKRINHLQTIIATLTVLLSAFLIFSCEQLSKNEQTKVLTAYHLRIDGNADSTITILEQVISEDSNCAMAWYELARTEHQMGLGNPRQMAPHLEEALLYIDKAILIDPKNPAYLYYKGILQSLNMYMALQMGKEHVQEDLDQIEENYLVLLDVRPDFHVAKLCLVDLYSFVPSDMGGNASKTEQYTIELEQEDLVYGAKAREIILPEEGDYVAFWSELIDNNRKNAELFEALGKVYLYNNDPQNAWVNFKKAKKLDYSKNYLYLDMGRYYTMQAMQGQIAIDSAVPLINAEYEKYLSSKFEPNNSMKAWTIGQMAMLKFRNGDEEGGKLLMEEAKALDPYFSRAFGTPHPILFVRPDAVSQKFQYLSRPY